MKKKVTILVIILLVVSIIITKLPKLNGPYLCSYVYDGDTICVVIDDQNRKVRLIGVDTPESVAPEEYEKENTAEGEIAKEYTNSILLNTYVFLDYDKDQYDDYGRLLAYVYLDDGKTMFNLQLLWLGYGKVMSIRPNTKYEALFKIAELYAKNKKLGFWANYYIEEE